MESRGWTDREDDFLRALWNTGANDRVIAQKLGELGFERVPRAIEGRRQRLGLLSYRRGPVDRKPPQARSPGEDLAPVKGETFVTQDYEALARMNDRFSAAMMAAIEAGLEAPTIGVRVDKTPFVGRVVHPEPVHSGCTSAASLCADVGS